MAFVAVRSVDTLAWAQVSAVTDSQANYPIGVDFALKVSDEFPLKVGYDRFLKALDTRIEIP